MVKIAVCLKIPKHQGAQAIALVGKMGLIDRSLNICHDETFLFIPLLHHPTEVELKKLENQINPKTLREIPLFLKEGMFEEKSQPSKTFKQALQSQLPSNLLAALPQAFDIVGDIVIIDISPSLRLHQNLIGEAILQSHKNIKTVLAKAGDISGVYRVRDYAFVSGEHKTRTVHREFGCNYTVDVAKAYFSPRLSHEHQRVASQVKLGEVVVDLFAGVGPFSVLIAKEQPQATVYAIDLNPDAVELLKINIKANKVESRVFSICADAREISAGKLKGVADRLIMNLPETAIDFVDVACYVIKPAGGVVHFYGFVRAPDTVANLMQRFTQAIERSGRVVKEFLYVRSIRETAPFESQIVLDVQIQ
ncbi:MAG: class I SAM-dependent methyltransferase family protein [Nitrososphaerota archaeon]|jgi:tRNA (guanine37-N1)-methyltransferase|nr:class I SAM-dependent methyltransferase family protein [Nitrososphaerota archaeon]